MGIPCLQPLQERSRPRVPSLAISEKSIVLAVGEDFKDEYHRAHARRGLNGVDPTVRERQLEAPCICEGRRKTAPRREPNWNSIFRNLVARKHVFFQACNPPSKLSSLLRLEPCLGREGAGSQPNRARAEASQVNGPPMSSRPSRTRARRSVSTSHLSNLRRRSRGACSGQWPAEEEHASSSAGGGP